MLLQEFFISLLILKFVYGEDVFVDVEQGRLKGYSESTLRLNKKYFSFKGIPYAKPRVGDNKFEVCIGVCFSMLNKKNKNNNVNDKFI